MWRPCDKHYFEIATGIGSEEHCVQCEADRLRAENERLREDLRLIATRCVVTLDGDLWAVVNADGGVTHLSSDFGVALDAARKEG